MIQKERKEFLKYIREHDEKIRENNQQIMEGCQQIIRYNKRTIFMNRIIVIFAISAVCCLAFLGWKTSFYGIAFPISVERFYNMSKVNIVDDSTFSSRVTAGVVIIDTTAFPLSFSGTGQIWAVNTDADDTLLISFDNGDNWLEILTNYSSAVFNPANYDSVHFKVHAKAGSDSTITPIILWTSFETSH